MSTKTENLELNIYSRDEKVVDWLNGSDQNFQIIDNTVGKVLTRIEQSSRHLASCIELDEHYGIRVEELTRLSPPPFCQATTGINSGNYAYIFYNNGIFARYEVISKKFETLEVKYKENKESDIVRYSSLPKFLIDSTKIEFNGTIYMFRKTLNYPELYKYNVEENLFTKTSFTFLDEGINQIRNEPMVLCGHYIYIFGINVNHQPISFKFDVLNERLYSISSQVAMSLTLAISDENEENIYLFGGSNTDKGTKLGVYKYNIANDNYTLIGSLPDATSGIGGARIKNNVYLFGGNKVSNARTECRNTIYVFNLNTEQFKLLDVTLPVNLVYLDCFMKKGAIYMLGGNENYTYYIHSDSKSNPSIYKFTEY